MLKIIGNDIKRGGVKLGWIDGNDIRNHEGKKLGYFTSNDVYRADGVKIGFTQGNELYFVNSGRKVHLDDLRQKFVVGGSFSDLARAAVLILIGD